MVITSVTKAGGSQFHGSGFFTARNYTLNSNDAYAMQLASSSHRTSSIIRAARSAAPSYCQGRSLTKTGTSYSSLPDMNTSIKCSTPAF